MYKIHRPPHIYQNDTIYFITAHTFNHEKILVKESNKQFFWDILNEKLNIFGARLYAWTVNIDHYHLLIHFNQGVLLKKFIQHLHGKSSFLLNKADDTPERKIWFSYWDRCVRVEEDFFKRLNYIHHNAIKHGYVKVMDEFNWSSYRLYVEQFGQNWIDDCFIKYPIKDFTIECAD